MNIWFFCFYFFGKTLLVAVIKSFVQQVCWQRPAMFTPQANFTAHNLNLTEGEGNGIESRLSSLIFLKRNWYLLLFDQNLPFYLVNVSQNGSAHNTHFFINKILHLPKPNQNINAYEIQHHTWNALSMVNLICYDL